MSYDLMVFDQSVAPQNRPAFLDWYKARMKSDVGLSQHTPATLSGNLRAFYDDLRQEFPPMNGPDAFDFNAADAYFDKGKFGRFLKDMLGKKPKHTDERKATEYSLGGDLIYMNFAWSQAQLARSQVTNAVIRHDVGFFDVSETNGMIAYGVDDLYAKMGL